MSSGTGRSTAPTSGAQPAVTDPQDRVVTINDRSATRIDMDVAASSSGDRYLRLGEAYDERWTLTVDGKDAGEPILVDGYSTGWLIDGDAHHLEARFSPQRAVEVSFVASAVGVVGVTAIAVLPTPGVVRDRRRHRVEPVGTPPAGAAP